MISISFPIHNNDSTSVEDVLNNPASMVKGAWISAGIFVLLSFISFIFQFKRHLSVDIDPSQDLKIKRRRLNLALIGMIPAYSITGFLSMFFLEISLELELVRSLYESVVLISFMYLLINLMGGHDASVRLLAGLPQDKYFNAPPCCCCFCCICPEVFIHENTFQKLRYGIIQYAIIRPITIIIALPLYYKGLYIQGDASAMDSYPYLRVFEVILLFIALYCLFILWKSTRKPLSIFQTGMKFLAIKLIVFLTAVQTVVITVIVQANAIKEDPALNSETKGELWNNWLICFETFLISFIFLKGFPISDYSQSISLETEETTKDTFLSPSDKVPLSRNNL
jgi:hypothetical protein